MTNAARDAGRGERVRVSGVDLWVDTVGDGPVVVLLAGADTPGFRWAPDFVDALVGTGRRVVRFDHRDCGRSTHLGPEAGYLLSDMAADVAGLLDRLDVADADLIGHSMGGMVAQVLALDAADRVRSLTLLSTTPGAGDDRLPGPDDDFVDKMTRRLFDGPPPDVEGRVGWLAQLVEFMAGPITPFDRTAAEALARAELATGWNQQSGHGVAVFSSPTRLDRLAEVRAPTLVVHGTADPVFPVEHGRALALGIDGAVLVEVDELGHDLPAPVLHSLTPAVLHHLDRAADWPLRP